MSVAEVSSYCNVMNPMKIVGRRNEVLPGRLNCPVGITLEQVCPRVMGTYHPVSAGAALHIQPPSLHQDGR